MTLVLCIALAVIAGAAGAFQAAANSGLAARIGLPQALVVNTTLVLACVVAFWLIRGGGATFHRPGTPIAYYLGGIGGFLIIAALAFAFPKIGAARAVALAVLGQAVAALIIDHFALLGVPRDPVTLRRAAGLALTALGAFLVR